MKNESLDILMGKHIDGEITPEEQRLLDRCLADDKAAREEFESFLRLHQQTRSAVGQVLESGRPMEEIFETAWQMVSPVRQWQSRFFRREWILTAAGLAAGLVIGFVIHAMILTSDNSIQPNPRSLVQIPTNEGSLSPSGTTSPRIVPVENRYIDWYTLTEPSGDQLLLEGYRRQQVTPAMYYGDL